MAVGDVFKKRRNLVQRSAGPTYGSRVNAFKVEPLGNPMRPEDYRMVASGPRTQPAQPAQPSGLQGAAAVERTEWDALGDLNAEDPNWLPRWRAERTLGDQVRQMMDRNAGVATPLPVQPRTQQGILQGAAAALGAIQQDRQQFPYGEARTLRPAQVRPLTPYTGDLPVEQPVNPMSPASEVPSINIWNNGHMRYSPQGGVYAEDPANDPNRGIYDLRDQIDALRERSQLKYPMVPNSPVQPANPLAQGLQQSYDQTTRQGEIMFTPGATSSYGATKNFRNIAPEELNGVTAGTANGYNGNVGYVTNPMRLTPERKESLAGANARRIVGGGAAADPTNIGGRFGGAYGAGLEADAAAIRDGRAVRTADGKVVYFTGTQESARDAQNAGKTDREWLRNRNNMNVPQEELDRRAGADARKAERAAKHQAFKDANGGMNYRQYDRMTGSSSGNNALTMKAVREGRLSPEEANYRMQLRAEKALRRSGNPITGGTSQAGRFFPDQMAGGQAQAPAALANPIFGPGSGNTADARQARQKVRQGLFAGVPANGDTPASPPHPVFSDLGITGDTSVPQFQGVMNSAADTGAEFTPDGIRQLLIFSQTFDPHKGAKTPFQNTGDPMASALDELYGMPESATDQQLMDWWNRYVAKRKETYQAGSYGTTFESGF